MSTPGGKPARHWFEEVWNRRRAEAVDELLAPCEITSRVES